MNGLMMDYPLTLSHILERSAKIYPAKEIASRMPDGSMRRYRTETSIGAYTAWSTL